jgi:hypothetical protein
MASMVLPVKYWNPSRSLSFFHVLLRPSRVAPCIRCSAPSNSSFATINVKLFKWRLFIPGDVSIFLASQVFEGHGQLLVDYHKSKASSSKKKWLKEDHSTSSWCQCPVWPGSLVTSSPKKEAQAFADHMWWHDVCIELDTKRIRENKLLPLSK